MSSAATCSSSDRKALTSATVRGRPPRATPLLPLEDGLSRAILQEAAHAGLLVRGGEQGGELQPLDLEPGGQVDLEAVVDRLLGGTQGERRGRRVLRDQVPGGLVDVGVRYHPVGKSGRQ